MNTTFEYRGYVITILDDEDVVGSDKIEITEKKCPDIAYDHAETVEEAIKNIDELLLSSIDAACAIPEGTGFSSARQQNATWNMLWPKNFRYAVWVYQNIFEPESGDSCHLYFYQKANELIKALEDLKQLFPDHEYDIYEWVNGPVKVDLE